MMAELGQTTDPKALIPGEPSSIEDTVAKLRQQSEKFGTVGDDLKRVDVVGWTGESSTAFMDLFTKEPPKWFKVCDLLDAASTSLTEYAFTLRWAQGQATEAIARWEEGEAATEKAAAEYNEAVAQANAQNQANAAAGSANVVSLAPFSDPGERARKEAIELLARAREQLEDFGRRVAERIGRQDSRERGLLDELVDAVTHDWKTSGKAEASGLGAGFEAKGPADGKLGELKAFAQLGKASAEGSTGNEFLKLSGKAEAGAEAALTAAASITDEGLKGRVEAGLGGKASAEGRVDVGPLGANGKAEVFGGAQAGAQVTVGPKGVSATADAFAGAKGTVKGGGDIGGIGVNVVAEGWAGVGAEAGVTVGQGDDGKWHVGANAGGAYGLGGKLGFELTVDPAKVTKTVTDAAETVGKIGEAAGDVYGDAQRTISGWLD
ncbi:hypothetical protein SAMN05216215_10904 [Saccharopolyspora shandongensis]|uniref:Putative T7SS secretion signal domain-containing protein n=1 Tax=Saccharopolyspora shandongensis TaxID=418495 RepID=A0A1H3TTJ4_9PSEU|nr:hypothetical protein [Saccharopolyspora shandongensis]SDZ52649.1 hypothetical protein SAMN05216215_10904 [Saccharopolyspora shandongensis]